MDATTAARPKKAIFFAWLIEICAVILGLVNAYMTSLDQANLPLHKAILIAAPFAMIAVAELSRIPLVQLFFYSRSYLIRMTCLVAVIATAGLTIENFAFGIERLVNLRAEDVTAARKAQTAAEENQERLGILQTQALNSIQGQREQLEASRNERTQEIERLNQQIAAVEDGRQKDVQQHTERCKTAGARCNSAPYLTTINDQANRQLAPLHAALATQRNESNRIRAELENIIVQERDTRNRADQENRNAQNEVAKAKQAVSQIVDDSQMHRIAAMAYSISPREVTDEQFSKVRAFFSLFSAIIISVMGTTLAIGYYSEGRSLDYRIRLREARLHLVRARSKFYRGLRSLLARRRKRLIREVERVVEVPVDRAVERIVEVTREVPVDRIVEKEVLREVPVERVVERPVEVIKEVPVDRVVIEKVERIVEVPVEHQKIVEVIKEVPVEVQKVVKEIVEKPVVHVREMIKYVPESWRGAVETKHGPDTTVVVDLDTKRAHQS
jgi:hypothetical protein